jgi:hypothetical protein
MEKVINNILSRADCFVLVLGLCTLDLLFNGEADLGMSAMVSLSELLGQSKS